MTRGHVFIATSLDGFIARPDGSLDWLISRDAPDEDHGYDAFIAGMDCIIMGRGSFDVVRAFPDWPYTLPVLVLSRQLAMQPVPEDLIGKVIFAAHSPEQAIQHLATQGHRNAYVDGGQIVQSFLRAGLIDSLTITTAPVLIGQGRPLFGALPQDIPLQHTGTRTFPSGLVQSTWRLS